MIREGKTYQIPSVIQTGKKDGMQSLDSSILDLLKRRVVTSEEAYAKAANKNQFRQYLATSSVSVPEGA
jgi:twitching motility protein PilT